VTTGAAASIMIIYSTLAQMPENYSCISICASRFNFVAVEFFISNPIEYAQTSNQELISGH
jgi:hypothetical protein